MISEVSQSQIMHISPQWKTGIFLRVYSLPRICFKVEILKCKSVRTSLIRVSWTIYRVAEAGSRNLYKLASSGAWNRPWPLLNSLSQAVTWGISWEGIFSSRPSFWDELTFCRSGLLGTAIRCGRWQRHYSPDTATNAVPFSPVVLRAFFE